MSGCWAPGPLGEPVTTHPHFEGRCVAEPLDDEFRERLEAYLAGGWEAWEAARARQRERRARAWSAWVDLGGEGG